MKRTKRFKQRASSRSYLCADRLTGSVNVKDLREFFYATCKATSKGMRTWARCCKDSGFDEDCAFVYGEQQGKSYLTAAIANISGGFYMQEYPVDRSRAPKPGWVDYWAVFKTCSFLIEAKYAQVRYYHKTPRATFYARTRKAIEAGDRQLKSIGHKGDFKYTNSLYALTIVMTPFIVMHEQEPRPIEMSETVHNIIYGGCANSGADIILFWRVPQKDLYLDHGWISDVGKPTTAYFPGLCFMGKISKVL